MKTYLIDYFNYNNWANTRLLQNLQLPDAEEAVMLFSHLITSQNKWLNRITQEVADESLSWFGPIFTAGELQPRWDESMHCWMAYLDSCDDATLEQVIVFYRSDDGRKKSCKIREIIFQLNCHSVHHRAQINRIMRQQGINPPATDYMHMVMKES